MAASLDVEVGLAAAAALLLSLAQRQLSTPVRAMRRRVVAVNGTVEYARRDDARRSRARPDRATPERALRLLAVALPLLGAALVVTRL